jgi:hypothetical protein
MSDLNDPKPAESAAVALDTNPVGDMAWFCKESGFSRPKAARLCRIGAVRGAYQAQPGKTGSMWHFRKSKTLAWLESLQVAK